jgi:hypothetical protein
MHDSAVSNSYQHGLVSLFNTSFVVFSEKLQKKDFGDALEAVSMLNPLKST